MAHQSEPAFRAFHALRIKGFAKVEMVADIADVTAAEAEAHLQALLEREHAMFREARALWQITPAGKEAHREALAVDSPASVTAGLHGSYETFLGINTAFKELCGATILNKFHIIRDKHFICMRCGPRYDFLTFYNII